MTEANHTMRVRVLWGIGKAKTKQKGLELTRRSLCT